MKNEGADVRGRIWYNRYAELIKEAKRVGMDKDQTERMMRGIHHMLDSGSKYGSMAAAHFAKESMEKALEDLNK